MQWIIFFLMIFAFPAYGTCETPLITSTSGVIASGNVFEVIGSNFLDENMTNWGTAYKSGTKYGFEGSSYSVDGYDAAGDMIEQERAYDRNVYLMGSQSYRGRVYGTSNSCPSENRASGIYSSLADDGLSGQDIYVRMYSKWKSAGSGSKWPDSHIKMLDVQGTGTQLYLQPEANGSLPNKMNMVYGGANHLYSVSNFLQEDRWYCMEARFKWSSPSNFTAWVDGVQLASTNSVEVGNYQYVLFNIINACGFTNLDLTNWTDSFAISTSRIYPASQIWISNSSTFSAATAKKQEPIFLSDSSVRFKLSLTGLSAGQLYLFITNNRQETSAAYSLGTFTGPAPDPGGSVIFTESFNDSALSSRGWQDDFTDVWIDSGNKQSGAAAWRQTWNAGATNVRNSANSDTVMSVRKVIGDGNNDELYVEWYWYLNSDYVGSGRAYHPHLIEIIDSLWSNLSTGPLAVYLELDGQNLRAIVRRSSVEDWHPTGYKIPLGAWKKIGAHLKMNTVGQADGLLRLYVDGTQVYSRSNITYRTSSSIHFNTISIAPWIGDGSPQTQTIWMDELTMSSGLISDDIAAPTGLRIISPAQ